MTKTSLWRLVVILVMAAVLAAPPSPSWAFLDDLTGSLTIDKEKQIGEEFLLELQQVMPIVEDPFLTSYLNRIGQRLVNQLGPQPFRYRFFIIDDPSMNAFAVPGGYVFVTTGMIRQTEHEGELAGVLAHEISHVYARHMARQMEKAKVTNIATLIAAMASIFLGGALAQPLLVGAMAAGQGTMLKYSREFEQEADGLGFKWMMKAGYNPRDMITIFNKMNKQRWFEGGEIPLYLSTHPGADSRIVELSHQLAINQGHIPQGVDNPDYQYFEIKVETLTSNGNALLRRMDQAASRDPKNPAYQYGRALALDKLDKHNEATAAFQQALKLSPANSIIQRDLAIYYFHHNRYPEAQKLLEDLSQRNPRDDAVLYYLGRIYQEHKQLDKALPLFEKVHNLNPSLTEVYLNLGTIYGEKHQLGLAHYYLGFYSLKAKAYTTALFHFRKAMANFPSYDNHYAEVKRQVARLDKLGVKVRD
jgi:beta-barrel assembly-enhancing protease